MYPQTWKTNKEIRVHQTGTVEHIIFIYRIRSILCACVAGIKTLFSIRAIPLELRAGLELQIDAIHTLVAPRAPIVEPPTMRGNAFLILHFHCVALCAADQFTIGDCDPLVTLVAVLECRALEGVSRMEGPHLGEANDDRVAKVEFDILFLISASGLGEHGLARFDARRGVTGVRVGTPDVAPSVTLLDRVAAGAFDALEGQTVFSSPGEVGERSRFAALSFLGAHLFVLFAVAFEFLCARRQHQVEPVHALVASTAPVMDSPVLSLNLAFGVVNKQHFPLFDIDQFTFAGILP